MNVRARCRVTTEATLVVPIQADDDDPVNIGEAEVLEAVFSSGELLGAIDVEIEDFEVVA